jgi:hypothetical protein
MKDYLDIWVLLTRETLNTDTLATAIAATFVRRGMQVPVVLPIGLTVEFATDPSRQSIWLAFLKKNRLAVTPLLDVVNELQTKLQPVLLQAAAYLAGAGDGV